MRTNLNLFFTMALGGLWHGAAWNFLVWGAYHGLALVAHKEFQPLKARFPILHKMLDTPLGRWFSIFLTFNIVSIGGVIFRIQDVGTALTVVRKMALFTPITTSIEHHQFLLFKSEMPVSVPITLTMVAVLVITNLPWSRFAENGILHRTPAWMKATYCCVMIVAMLAFMPDTSAPFIYFQF